MRFRAAPLAFAALAAAVLAALGLADRSITAADQTQADLHAAEAGALVESFVTARTEALGAFRGLYATPGAVPDSLHFAEFVESLDEHVAGFRRVWVTDSAGVVVWDRALSSALPPLARFDVDTLARLHTAAAAALARRTGRTALTGVGPLFADERGFAILEPLTMRGRFVGFAGATVTAAALGRALPAHLGHGALASTLVAGPDTVAVLNRQALAGATRRGRHALKLGNTVAPWHVEVTHAATDRTVRLGMWGLGLGIVGVLTVWLAYARRQAARLADRTTELERLSAELLRANRSKSEFLANVSHELRTPLNAIVGFTELLREGVYGELNARQAGPVGRIEASATHLRHLVDQILDLAKMAAGRLEVHAELVDLRPFTLDVATEVEPLVGEKGLQLSLAVPATLPRVRTDPTHLRQIIVNLLANAVRYTERGSVQVRARLVGAPPALATTGSGRVISGEGRASRALTFDPGPPPAPARPGGAWVALQVVDTGVGIALADQARVFEEFEQVTAGARGDSMRRGTGLGLPISRRLAHLLGGDVTLDSQPGRGSTFTLWIPVDAAELGAAREERGGGVQAEAAARA